MRRAMIGLLALALMVCLGFGFLHNGVSDLADQVTVTQQILYGDPSAANGVQLLVRNQYADHLLWETGMTLGEENSLKTEFTFDNDTVDRFYSVSYTGVSLNELQSIFSFMDYDLPEATQVRYADAIAYFKEAEASVPEGEVKSFTVDLAEYLDYYPLFGQIDLPGVTYVVSEFDSWHEEYLEIGQKISDFFRIPMDMPHVVEWTVDKTSPGSSYGAIFSDKDFYFYARGTVTENACYFTFNGIRADGSLVDTSLIPGGYGIYCLPYGEKGVDIDGLSMVYALDQSEEYEGLFLSGDGKRLLLFTWQGDDLTVTVIDIATMTQVQKEVLWSRSENKSYHLVTYAGYFLIEERSGFNSDHYRVMVWEEQRDGTFAQTIDAPFDWALFPEGREVNPFDQYDNAVTYTDGKLAVVWHQTVRDALGYRSKESCDVYVAVFENDAMCYAGSYQWNLTMINEQDYYATGIEPLYHGSLEISW